MIVDSHYHYMTAMSEKGAAEMVGMLFSEARKMGMNADYDTMLQTAVRTWADPLANRLIENMDEAA
jgi:hypothetical protein